MLRYNAHVPYNTPVYPYNGILPGVTVTKSGVCDCLYGFPESAALSNDNVVRQAAQFDNRITAPTHCAC